MIGRLRGRVDGRGEGWVLVDVGGVGYMVEGSARLMDGCPPDGEAVSLAIETYVREDQFRLFGFLSEEERSWFRLLMGVQGVGAKVALAIQSVLSPADLVQAVAAEDKAMVARAPGVGPKVAQRIVQELKDKVPETAFGAVAGAGAGVGTPASQAHLDAMSALTNLGYQRAEAHRALQAAGAASAGEADASAETLIRKALKELAK
ncbi:MAG: Holliday junction branch migration protein RuvA [Rhizobiales bacterium TMED83]|jgi:Holliday junction DNA helicase RuvA|nr:Holliday junction branch migration protein RuvA [Rhodobiaceae bacterium]RPF94476.1 MAG: Holliday junction branch migration protein RuvA [Rhizobiales bacterium TMED83]